MSKGDCYFISGGSQGFAVGSGFSFYFSPKDQLYHIKLMWAEEFRHLKFLADFKSQFVLIRIISPDEGGKFRT